MPYEYVRAALRGVLAVHTQSSRLAGRWLHVACDVTILADEHVLSCA